MVFLALRHLFARKRQSLFTLVGIFLGTASFVLISGFFLGFQNYLTDQLVSNDAHIKVSKNDEKTSPEAISQALMRFPGERIHWIRAPNPRLNSTEIKNQLGWVERIKSTRDVEAVGIQYTTTALISKAGISQSASLIGVEPEAQLKITNIGERIVKGDFADLRRGMDLVVIGETLADDLGVGLEDIINVTASSGSNYPMKIVAIYSSGNRMGDRGTAYTSLSTAQKVGRQNGAISQISVRVKDPNRAAEIAERWKNVSLDKVESWDQANASFLSIFQTQDMMRYGTITVLLMVASFGIYNVLSMVVMQKRRDIAILRSMGFEHSDVLKLFLLQGVILGLLGSLLGLGIGFAICKFLSTLTMTTPQGSSSINMSFDLAIYTKALALGIGASCVAAYLPSRSAAKMTPIDIIRAGAE